LQGIKIADKSSLQKQTEWHEQSFHAKIAALSNVIAYAHLVKLLVCLSLPRCSLLGSGRVPSAA
jgi:hypothetical protein